MVLFGFISCILGILKLIMIYQIPNEFENEIEDMVGCYTSDTTKAYQLLISTLILDSLINIICGGYIFLIC